MPQPLFESALQHPPGLRFDDVYLGILVHSLNILPVRMSYLRVFFYFVSSY